MTTPTCPACGAKFSHSKTELRCNKCGLPDEIRDAGPQAIVVWKRGKLPHATTQPQVDFTEKRGARLSRRPRKHGRATSKSGGSSPPMNRYRKMSRTKRGLNVHPETNSRS